MALTKCPECGQQVSDKAKMCPHCGSPLVTAAEKAIADFNKLMQNAVDLPQFKRIEMARDSYLKVFDYLVKKYGGDNAAAIILKLISTCVGVDDTFDRDEYEFILNVIRVDIGYQDLLNIVKECRNEIEYIDSIIDGSPNDVKLAFVNLCLCIFACNNEITVEEKALLVKYLA